MKYFSTFSGIGGFELGIKNVVPGAKCVGFSEIDKYAIQTYEKNFPNHKNYEDIKRINTATLPDFDCFVGGFPCQSFSIAGKRGGFDDIRGTLFFECARIIRDKRPRNFVLENVKGLLSHEKGETFKTIIRTLDELGYFVEWQVLNSKNFGVPQNRERVFIVGHIGGVPKRKVFPIGGGNKKDTRNVGGDLSYAIDASYSKGTNTLAKGRRQMVALTERRTEEAKQIRKETKGRDFSPRRAKVLEPRGDNIGNCLTANQSKEGLLSDGVKIRRLTPTECERLQGFPDGWTDGVSDTQRYKQCGNAVTVNVIESIFKKLKHE